jgi:hypothetical protein
MLFCLMFLLKYLIASFRSVPGACDSDVSSSLTIYNACCLPFFGGTYNSTLLLKKIAPTLSLLLIALKASTAAISLIMSRFLIPTVPKILLALVSISSITVSSRSSSNTFVNV